MLGFNSSVAAGLVSAALLIATSNTVLAGAGAVIPTSTIETAVRNVAATRIPATVTALSTKPGTVGTSRIYNPTTGHTVGVVGTAVGGMFRVTDGGHIGGCLLIANSWVDATLLNGGQDFLAWYSIEADGFPTSAAAAEQLWTRLYGAGSLLGHERMTALRKDSKGRVIQFGYVGSAQTSTANTSAVYNYSKTIDLSKGKPTANFIAGAGTRWQAYSR